MIFDFVFQGITDHLAMEEMTMATPTNISRLCTHQIQERYLMQLIKVIRHPIYLIVSLMVFSVSHAQPGNFDRLMQSSLQAEARGDWGQAIQLSQQMLKMKPNDLGVMVALSGFYGYAGFSSQQLLWAQKVIAIDPKNFDALINQGNAYAAEGKQIAAMASYRAAESVDPASPIPAYSKGVLSQSQGREKEAIGYFRTALQLSPKFEDAQFNLAVSLANLGELSQAIEVLNHLLRQNPKAADAAAMRGELRTRLGQSR